ncbi:MAG: hypothetical protein HZC02_04815 [Candidatus Levybacteria bacterium]|nr:hypothetical protein [Candidatus Levybacteria bacterium]
MSIKIHKRKIPLFALLLILIIVVIFGLKYLSSSKKVSPVSTQSVSEKKTDELPDQKNIDAIKKVATTQSAMEAWQYVINTYSKDTANDSAHEYAHFAGKLLFEAEGLNGMTICTPEFAFGCYHGLLDQAFQKDLSALSPAEKACAQIRNAGGYSSCIHGIGHGIASYFKVKELTSSLKTCDKLPKGAPQYCYDGVFMEFSREALDSFYRPDNPLYPCDSVGTKYSYACGRNQPTVMMSRLNKNFKESAEACAKAKDPDLKTACFVAIGFQAVYLSKQNVPDLISMCNILNDKNFQYQCLSAAAGEFIFQNMPDWQTKSPRVCQANTDKKQQDLCSSHLQEIQKLYRGQ